MLENRRSDTRPVNVHSALENDSRVDQVITFVLNARQRPLELDLEVDESDSEVEVEPPPAVWGLVQPSSTRWSVT